VWCSRPGQESPRSGEEKERKKKKKKKEKGEIDIFNKKIIYADNKF